MVAAGVYFTVGLLVATALQFSGLRRIDPGVENAGLVFRLLVTPGLVALWPLLLRRWRSAGRLGPRFGEANRPHSSAALRALHLKLLVATTLAVSLLFGIGLWARPGGSSVDAHGVDILAKGVALPTIESSWPDPFPNLPITINLRTDDSDRRQLELVVSNDLGIPDVALYWLAGDGAQPLGEGVFLGTVWGPDRRLFELPPAADGGGGSLVLYSMSHKERIARFVLPTRGGS